MISWYVIIAAITISPQGQLIEGMINIEPTTYRTEAACYVRVVAINRELTRAKAPRSAYVMACRGIGPLKELT